MLTALISTVTATLFGSADFLGGLASRKSPALLVSAVMFATGVLIFPLVLLVARPEAVTARDVGFGAVSGVMGMVGVLALYAALAIGRMSIVAPITAALSGSGPAIFDLLTGSQVSTTGLIGMALAIVSVIIVSTTTGTVEEHGMPPRAVGLSVLAGSCFGTSLVALSMTAPASGFAPLLVARIVGSAGFAIAVFVRRKEMRFGPDGLRLSIFTGVLDAAANVTMLTAVRIGPLAVAAVVGGLYPVATMLLARVFLAERLKRHQVAGVALALVAVVLTALP
jgi:drug/metabolite transporter (DMT)-like permease